MIKNPLHYIFVYIIKTINKKPNTDSKQKNAAHFDLFGIENLALWTSILEDVLSFYLFALGG